MRYVFAILILCFASSAAYAIDEFGQRFGNQPPFALQDSLDPASVIYIEPAAGAEEEDAEALQEEEQKEAVKGRVYPSKDGPSIEVRSSE